MRKERQSRCLVNWCRTLAAFMRTLFYYGAFSRCISPTMLCIARCLAMRPSIPLCPAMHPLLACKACPTTQQVLWWWTKRYYELVRSILSLLALALLSLLVVIKLTVLGMQGSSPVTIQESLSADACVTTMIRPKQKMLRVSRQPCEENSACNFQCASTIEWRPQEIWERVWSSGAPARAN